MYSNAELLMLRENARIDFKLKIDMSDETSSPKAKKSGKEKLLDDIVAMLNIGGGELIIGVREGRNGEPNQICPVEGILDEDTHRSQILNLAAEKILPRARDIDVEFRAEGSGHIYIIRIGNNGEKPYQNALNGAFYTRVSSQNRPLTAPEIIALASWKGGFERVTKFLDEQVELLEGRNALGKSCAAFHIGLLPMSSFQSEATFTPGAESFYNRMNGGHRFIQGKSDGHDFSYIYPYGAEREFIHSRVHISDNTETVSTVVHPLLLDAQRGKWDLQETCAKLKKHVSDIIDFLKKSGVSGSHFIELRATRLNCDDEWSYFFQKEPYLKMRPIIATTQSEFENYIDVFADKLYRMSVFRR